jgi:hypothetical protein
MKKLLLILPIVLVLVGSIMLFEQPAYAYADPGTGLLAIQAVGSVFVATGWYLRRKIYALLHRNSADQIASQQYTPAQEDRGSSRS